jgi:signal transduction histidine kinase
LTRLIECLLAFARAESGKIPLIGERVDLGEMAKSVLDVIRVLAEEKHQKLQLQVFQPATIQGDPATLRQALINLLDNAIRYTPNHGHVQLRIGVMGDGSPMVEVEDDGPGIPEPDRDRIFDRFYRSQSDCSKANQGTGLGLAIARSATEANGGKLTYEDVPTGGSRFRMTFPMPLH